MQIVLMDKEFLDNTIKQPFLFIEYADKPVRQLWGKQQSLRKR